MGDWTKCTDRNDKTLGEREPSILPLYKLYTSFRLHFAAEKKVQHSRVNFFDLKRETNETEADIWKRISQKNCEFGQ